MQTFESKESSNVGWARYDEATETLEIDFKGKDGLKASTYTYAGFPRDAWWDFQHAQSKGRHFAAVIRPKYKGVRKP